MDLVTERVRPPRLPWRAIGVLAMIALLLATALAVYVGSRPRLPDPFGVATNGDIVYATDGDILVRDDVVSAPRVLIGGPTDDHDPWFTPDGQTVLFIRTTDGRDYLMAADADGSRARALIEPQLVDATITPGPDSRSVAMVNWVRGAPKLSIIPVDGGDPIVIDTGQLIPTDLVWRPPHGRQLLVRARKPDMSNDFYLVDATGGSLQPINIAAHTNFGPQWDNSGPVWSIDGQRIFYNVVEEDDTQHGGHFRVHVATADGSDDDPLPGPDDIRVQEAWPLLSPDGRTILVHRWTWGSDGEGWLAVMPADGSAIATDIGPRIAGGESTGLIKTWSPAGDRVLMRTENTQEVFSIDPASGEYERLDWNAATLPDWQRRGN